MSTNIIKEAVQKFSRPKAARGLFAFEGGVYPLLQSKEEDVEMSELSQRYNIISLEFLSMRREDGWPKFAVYGVNDPLCAFSCDARSYRSFGNYASHTFERLAEMANLQFEDIFAKLIAISGMASPKRNFWGKVVGPESENKVTISHKFAGLLPDSTRDAIMEMPKTLVPYIIAEATDWVINDPAVRILRNPDPMVIGWHEVFRTAFLIDVFDVTSEEEMAAREFSEGPVSHLMP